MTQIISLKSLFQTALLHLKHSLVIIQSERMPSKVFLETELKVEWIESQRLVQIYTWISQFSFLASEPLSHITEAYSFVSGPFSPSTPLTWSH